ncbi:MAG: argininosuccinate lyase, partial [Limnochordia bacterium]
EDYANATDAADYLTNKGMPFREAHETVGRLIRHAISSNKYLSQLSLEEYRQFSPLFDTDIYQALDPQAVVARRTSYAGTSPEEVRKQIELARKKCVT